MKTKPGHPTHTKSAPTSTVSEPSEASIRECAYGLYEKANRCDGHDVDHWVEATAVLKAETVGAHSDAAQ